MDEADFFMELVLCCEEFKQLHAFVPNEQFLVVRYDLTNPGDSARTVDLLDMLHIRNETGANVSAAYSAGDHTVRYDLSGARLPSIAH